MAYGNMRTMEAHLYAVVSGGNMLSLRKSPQRSCSSWPRDSSHGASYGSDSVSAALCQSGCFQIGEEQREPMKRATEAEQLIVVHKLSQVGDRFCWGTACRHEQFGRQVGVRL